MQASQRVLGYKTCGYVIYYVDDILVFSRSFDQHMDHLDTVLNKLTSAGFTINARKYSFCKAGNKICKSPIQQKKN